MNKAVQPLAAVAVAAAAVGDCGSFDVGLCRCFGVCIVRAFVLPGVVDARDLGGVIVAAPGFFVPTKSEC